MYNRDTIIRQCSQPTNRHRCHLRRRLFERHRLLLPTEDPRATPTLDGRTVEVVDRTTEWEVLDGLFLKSVRTTGSPA
ncbi:hypothetical protein ACFY20_34230 [Streptomyces sp. NPDC001312]|uniref:hypothetical protein n=1 Tax=Streptomyces sp. NPDC001312 TaxID=3364561 RepID=UPI003674EBD1